MADVFTIPIEDTTVVDGTADIKIAVTTGSYYLRVSPFSSNTYSGTHLSKGVWSFGDVNDGIYQLWDDSGQIANYGEFYIGDNNPTFTSLIMTGDIDMVGNDITYANSVQCDTIIEKATNGVSIDGVVLKDGAGKRLNGTTEADNDVVFKTGNQTIAGNKTLTGTTIMSGTVAVIGLTSVRNFSIATGYQGVMSDAPSGATSLVNKQYVDNQVANLAITPYQNSANIVRLIPRGTQQTNQVYTSWGLAQNVATSYAGSTRPMTIVIEGLPADGSNIEANNGAIPGLNTFNSYVSVTSLSQRFAVELTQDESVTVNNCILTNLFLRHDDGGQGSSPNFNGFVFVNCYINIVSCSSFTFTNCEFRGHCTIKCSSGTVIYTSCKGGVVVTNTTLPSTVVGFDNLTLANI